MSGRLKVLDGHALAEHKLTILRDRDCAPDRFRRVLKQISLILCSEMMRDLDTKDVTVITPNGLSIVGRQREQTSLVVMLVLRSGLVMAEAFSELLPRSRGGHVGIYRASDGHHQCYMLSIPKTSESTKFIVLDPVISQGGTAALAVDLLLGAKVRANDIRFGCIVATSEGVHNFYNEARRQETEIFTFAIDSLSEANFAMPGLGNVGSRLFNTEEENII